MAAEAACHDDAQTFQNAAGAGPQDQWPRLYASPQQHHHQSRQNQRREGAVAGARVERRQLFDCQVPGDCVVCGHRWARSMWSTHLIYSGTRATRGVVSPCRPSLRIVIVSDTHGELDHRIAREAVDGDIVVHAGDIGCREVLDALKPRERQVDCRARQ